MDGTILTRSRPPRRPRRHLQVIPDQIALANAPRDIRSDRTLREVQIVIVIRLLRFGILSPPPPPPSGPPPHPFGTPATGVVTADRALGAPVDEEWDPVRAEELVPYKRGHVEPTGIEIGIN